MRAEISALQRELGVTTVYVTHDQVEAMTMGHRVAVLKDGVLQQVDTPQRLYDHPVNAFVAGFIGSPSMNLYQGILRRADDGWLVQLGEHQLVFRQRRPSLNDYVGRPLIVGIRPEDFEDAALASAADDGALLTAPVTLVESLGSEIMVHFRLDAIAVESGDPDAAETLGHENTPNSVGRFSPRSTVRAGDVTQVAVNVENPPLLRPRHPRCDPLTRWCRHRPCIGLRQRAQQVRARGEGGGADVSFDPLLPLDQLVSAPAHLQLKR